MAHTITIALSEAAQRAALLAGEPAAAEQTYEVPAELLPRLLALPWVAPDKDGEVHAAIPGYARIERKPDSPISWAGQSGTHIRWSPLADQRPADADAAIAHAETVRDRALAEIAATRKAWADAEAERERIEAERDASERARARSWAARPVAERVDGAFVANCVPLDVKADDSYSGPLTLSGRMWIDRDKLRRLEPKAWTEAEAEIARLKAEIAKEAERRAEIAKEAERRILAEHGTQDQRERWEARCLPKAELLEVARAAIFAPLEDLEPRPHLECDHDDACYAHDVGHGDDACDVEVETVELADAELDAEEWPRWRAVTAAAAKIPGAAVELRRHTATCRECDCEVDSYSARVTVEWAGRKLRRERRVS